MSKPKKITFVTGDDWEALYIGDDLVMENHSLSPYEVLRALGIEFKVAGVDQNWLEARGCLRGKKLSEIVLPKNTKSDI